MREETRHMLYIMKPDRLISTVQLAIHQEKMIECRDKNKYNNYKQGWNAQKGTQWPVGDKNKEKTLLHYKTPLNNNENIRVKPNNAGNLKIPPTKRMTPAEMEVRRKQNLCFNYDEIYHVGHRCKKSFVILVEEDFNEEEVELSPEEMEEEESEMVVTLNAVAGRKIPNTIKIPGRVGQEKINILINLGSTHNFLDPEIAHKVGCCSEKTHIFLVTIVNGSRVECNAKCSNFE